MKKRWLVGVLVLIFIGLCLLSQPLLWEAGYEVRDWQASSNEADGSSVFYYLSERQRWCSVLPEGWCAYGRTRSVFWVGDTPTVEASDWPFSSGEGWVSVSHDSDGAVRTAYTLDGSVISQQVDDDVFEAAPWPRPLPHSAAAVRRFVQQAAVAVQEKARAGKLTLPKNWQHVK